MKWPSDKAFVLAVRSTPPSSASIVQNPSITPGHGTEFDSTVQVSIFSPTAGAAVKYTLDGTVPGGGHGGCPQGLTERGNGKDPLEGLEPRQ